MWTTDDQKLGKNSRNYQNKQLQPKEKHRTMFQKPTLSTFPLENNKIAIPPIPPHIDTIAVSVGAFWKRPTGPLKLTCMEKRLNESKKIPTLMMLSSVDQTLILPKSFHLRLSIDMHWLNRPQHNTNTFKKTML